MNYIDSSAFVKYYSGEGSEKGSDKIKAIVDKAKDGEESLISSILLIGEVVSAFDKWVRLKILTQEQGAAAISEFVSDIKECAEKDTILLEDINLLHMTFSVDYIVKYHLPTNDALHLYTALIHKKHISTFISSDKSLNRAAEKEGFTVYDPEL